MVSALLWRCMKEERSPNAAKRQGFVVLMEKTKKNALIVRFPPRLFGFLHQ